MPRTYGPTYPVNVRQAPQASPRGPQLSSALSTASAPYAVPRSDGTPVIPWTAETTVPESIDHRTFPVSQKINAREELVAGVRTQPYVQKYQRTGGWKQFYNHVPVIQPTPTVPRPVQSSYFSPLAIWRTSWSNTIAGGDWITPVRYDGTWAHAAELVQPNPGGTQQLAQPRWTRTGQYPRASTIPPQFQPTQSGGARMP